MPKKHEKSWRAVEERQGWDRGEVLGSKMIPDKSEVEISQPWWEERDICVDEGNFHMQNFSGSLILFTS